MTSIETIGGLYVEETWIVTGGLISNSLHSKKSVQLAVDLACDRDEMFCLYILLEARSTPAVVILRNAVICFTFVIFALLTNGYHG
jgi:hypothetical protein